MRALIASQLTTESLGLRQTLRKRVGVTANPEGLLKVTANPKRQEAFIDFFEVLRSTFFKKSTSRNSYEYQLFSDRKTEPNDDHGDDGDGAPGTPNRPRLPNYCC